MEDHTGKLTYTCNATEVALHPGKPHSVTWTADKFEPVKFDIVIFAVGFGVERTKDPVPLSSYWRDDSLHQPQIHSRTNPENYLVSGCGDGGLTDLLRIRISQFRHELLVAQFLSDSRLDNLKDELKEIEKRRDQESEAWLTDKYLALQIPEHLDVLIRARLRNDTTAGLNGERESPLTWDSAVLNRFLVSRLLVYGRHGVTWKPGKLEKIERDPSSFGYLVHRQGKADPEPYHRVVIRHGAIPSLEKEFSAIQAACNGNMAAKNALDQTREPIWDEPFYPLPRLRKVPQPTAMRADPFVAGRAVDEVFVIGGTPTRTAVVTPEVELIRLAVQSPRKGLIVEGAIGGGRTTALQLALRLAFVVPQAESWAMRSADAAKLEQVLNEAADGTMLVIEDAHCLDRKQRERIAAVMGQNYVGAAGPKLLVTAVTGFFDELRELVPAVDGCVDVFQLPPAADSDIARMIRLGERAANLDFPWRDDIVEAAGGSFWAAQQLCRIGALQGGAKTSPDKVVKVDLQLSEMRVMLVAELMSTYLPALVATFGNGPAMTRDESAASLALLALLPVAEGLLRLDVAKLYYANQKDIADRFEPILANVLKNAILNNELLRHSIRIQDGIISVHDTRFSFFLRHASWVEIAGHIGVSISVQPDRTLKFR